MQKWHYSHYKIKSSRGWKEMIKTAAIKSKHPAFQKHNHPNKTAICLLFWSFIFWSKKCLVSILENWTRWWYFSQNCPLINYYLSSLMLLSFLQKFRYYTMLTEFSYSSITSHFLGSRNVFQALSEHKEGVWSHKRLTPWKFSCSMTTRTSQIP